MFIVSLHPEDCEDLASAIVSAGGNAGYFAADLAHDEQTREAFAAADGFVDGLDGLYAVAGGSGRRFGDGPAHEMTLDAWEKTFEANANPMFLATREAISRMGEGGGSVVIVSSVLATRPVPDLFPTHAYAAAKGRPTPS